MTTNPLLGRMLRALHRKYILEARPPEPFYTAEHPAYSDFDVGEWTYGKPRVLSWGEGATLKVGRFCSFAADVTIFLGGNHRVDWVTTYPFSALFENAAAFTGHPATRGDVLIGNDVWIADGACILSGVTIGNGAVVGARSVVARDVQPYAIVAGNPAQQHRFRFTPPIIQALQQIAWWNWPLSAVEEAWPLLLSSDIEAFVARYGARTETEHGAETPAIEDYAR